MWNREVSFSVLEGQTIRSVSGLSTGSDEVIFTTEQGNLYKMYHSQDCCENVSIEDLDGDEDNLVGAIVLSAEEIEGSTPSEGYWGDYEPESYTWTFYKIETNKGGVFIRWLGTSNGYYSENVSFVDLNQEY